MKTAALLLPLALLPSCRAPGGPPPESAGQPEEPATPPAAPEPGLELPLGWDAMGHVAFETWLEEALPEGTVTPLSAAARSELEAALAAPDESAVRAAALLARSASPAAAEVLMRRLEDRILGPQRDSDAGDVVAAAGLGCIPAGEPLAARLAALAVGADPHPDLEVRVECAAAALAHGRTETIPFLLRVLREATPNGLPDPPDWKPQDTMAWAKSRAAHALSLFAGAPLDFCPDASVADQDAAADRLEERLARRLAAAGR